MKNLYSEKKYRDYIKFMDKIIDKGLDVYAEVGLWLENNNVSKEMQAQMDDRIEKEFIEQLQGIKNENQIAKLVYK